MFSQRKTQRPAEHLLADFRTQYPEVSVTSTSPPSVTQTAGSEDSDLKFTDQDSPHDNVSVLLDQDPTPRGTNDPWRFTPSLMDTNSFSFTNFANGPSGYYNLTPGAGNTLFHHPAGDLHTPGGLGPNGIATPLSMPTSGESIQSMDMSSFQQQPAHSLQHFNPFGQGAPHHGAYAPSSFVHHDTGYETMDHDNSPPDSDPSEERMNSIDSAFHSTHPMSAFQPRQLASLSMSNPLPSSTDRFRFHSTLNAPTAMIKQADEIPITYLNKGQAYSLSIVDTHAQVPLAPGTKFRTFVRVSFEDDEQRAKPGVCWSLWKEGRGTNEAHQRGGKLQAVEYVEAGQPAEGDDKRTRVEIESASFDGFCVVWTPGSNGSPEVNIAIRFNFLSTDFSHSKGVKGIPVRLCAKTNRISPDSMTIAPTDSNAETCYCKVKLFRDHGAERKLSNDVAHVKKSMDKLKHQIAQAESGMKDFGKRKRTSGKPKAADAQRPGKAPKHKRTWSISSASSADGGNGEARSTMEDDLHFKLQTLQDMFSSTRPVSVLYLKGEDLDDPDLHPVSLIGEASPPKEGINWQPRSTRNSNAGSAVSPTPSSPSMVSQGSTAAVALAGQWQQGPDHLTKVGRTDEQGKLGGWIEALGVDPNYQPPPERTPKPVACLYALCTNKGGPRDGEYHRAIYLMQRSLEEFNRQIASKWNIDPTTITRTIHKLQSGLEVEVDDDVIRELREGQDMMVEFDDLSDTAPPPKREWDMSLDSPTAEAPTSTEGTILRLIF